MPTHSNDKKRAPADGGAATKTKTKAKTSAASGDSTAAVRGPGGKKKGKAAIRAEAKNAGAVKAVLDICRAAADSATLQADLRDEDLTLARVTAAPGGRHLVVTLMTGEAGVVVPISGVTAFRGGARTKGALPNYMGVGDLVVLWGAHARGKFSLALAEEIRELFCARGLLTPIGFFPDDEAAGAVGWCYDRDESRYLDESAADAAIATVEDIAAARIRASAGGYRDGAGAVGGAARDTLYGKRREEKTVVVAAADDVDVEAI
jgi:hypothetical protein